MLQMKSCDGGPIHRFTQIILNIWKWRCGTIQQMPKKLLIFSKTLKIYKNKCNLNVTQHV